MKNILVGIKSRINEAEKQISELEDRMVNITVVGQKKECKNEGMNVNLDISILLGLLGGLVLLLAFMGIYLLLYLLDDTIKTEEDVQKYLGMNTLAVIPLQEGEKSTQRGISTLFRHRRRKMYRKRSKGGKKS